MSSSSFKNQIKLDPEIQSKLTNSKQIVKRQTMGKLFPRVGDLPQLLKGPGQPITQPTPASYRTILSHSVKRACYLLEGGPE